MTTPPFIGYPDSVSALIVNTTAVFNFTGTTFGRATPYSLYLIAEDLR